MLLAKLSELKSLNRCDLSNYLMRLFVKGNVIKGFNINVMCSLLMVTSINVFAQEETVEVGKHANPNLDAMSMIASLLMVLAVIIVSAWILKKFNLANKSVSGMQVISSLPLGHKEKLVVVQIADDQLLLGVSGQQISLIKTLDKPLEVSRPLSPHLSRTFDRFMAKKSNVSAVDASATNESVTNKPAENNSSSNV